MVRTAPISFCGLLTAALLATPAAAQLSGKEIHLGVGGPLTTSSASLGTEMRNAVELAIAEQNEKGGILGARVVATILDDGADPQKGETVAKAFCDDPALFAVVGHANSGVTIAASVVYNGCGLPMVTPMSSNPAVTDRGLPVVFRLTNRDDRKGPAIAGYLIRTISKRRAVVIDDQTPYGKGLSELFVQGFEARGGTVVLRQGVKVGDTEFGDLVKGLPKDFDVLFFAGIREGGYILKAMRAQGLDQVFACGDGCWDVKNFIEPAAGAATKGEGVRVLSAAPKLGEVPGSREFAQAYEAKYGPISNYAANDYDSARVVMAAIETAAKAKGGMPSRADVLAALKAIKFQGIAYAKPVEWNEKGDSKAAVIFVNDVEGDHFKEIAELSP